MKKLPAPSTPAKKTSKKPAVIKKVQKKTGNPRSKEKAMDWEAVFRAIGSPAIIVAPDHTIRSANDATCRISGKTEAELTGMKCWEVFHEPDTTCPPKGCPMVQLLESGKHETAEMEVAMNGGVCLVSCTPVPGAVGTISSIIHIATDITDKKKAEQRVQESEERFRQIFGNSPVGMVIVTPDFRFSSVNPAWVAMTGYTEKELLRMSFKDITHPDHLAIDMEHIRELAAGKIPVYATEKRYIRKDKSILWGLIRVTAVRDQNGSLRQFAAQIEDITERKQAEDALRESEEKYRSLYRNSAIGIFHSSLEGRFIDVNPALAKMLGYNSPEEVVTSITSIAEQVYFEPPRYNAVTTTTLDVGKLVGVENKYRRRDGSLWYGRLHVRIVPDLQGRPSYYEGFVEDITGRKKAELALNELSAYNRSLIEASLDPLVTISPGGKIQDVNAATEKVTGQPRDKLIGTDFSDYFTEPDRAREGYLRVFSEGKVFDYPLEILHRAGHTIPVLYNATVYQDRDGKVTGVFAAARDITERRKGEEMRERHIRELAQKNAELDRFTYAVSHDLKSPLLATRAFLALLKDDLKSGDPGEVQRDIARIDESAEKLELLISTLLSLSRSGRVVDIPVRIPFSDLAREAAGLLEATIRERKVALVIPDHLPELFGDRERLLQVIINLIDNAVKFMGSQEEPRIEIGVREDAGTTIFFVRDNGIGIKKENLQKVFGLFERFNPDVPGTGIGLATVKRIIEAHGGKIWVESEGEGKGTTVSFTLPPVTKEGGNDREMRQE
jgi:PAS domain S-box-containing protein